MPAYDNTAAIPRQELAPVIVGGQGVNARNIWPLVLPLYPVDKRSLHLITALVKDASLLRIMGDKFKRQPGANFERVNMTFGESTLTLEERGQEVLIPDELELDFAGYFSTEAVGAQRAADMIDLTSEYLCAAAIFNTTNFGSATNSATAYTTANLATMTPIEDINLSIERVKQKGEVPDTIIIPLQVWQRIRQSTNVKGAVAQGSGFSPVAAGTVTTALFQQYFADQGIKQVLIADGRYNTADDGATPSFTKIWANTYIWVGKCGSNFATNENGMSTLAGIGGMFFWADFAAANGYGVETYRDETRKSNVVRAITTATAYIGLTSGGDLIGTQYS